MTKLVTERTERVLASAKLPLDSKSLMVPDDHPCMDAEQRVITAAFKEAFGTQAAESTLKVAIDKNGERQIYEPCIITKDNKVVIEWGGKIYPIPSNATFSSGRCLVVVEDGDAEYALKARILSIKKEDAKTKVQLAWATCPPADKADFLARAWSKGTIVEILSLAFATIYKLSELVGQHQVHGFYMGGFDKYVLILSDGRHLRANTALQNKLADYEEMGIEVSPDSPARLTVEPSKGKTHAGYDIHPVTLTSYRNLDLPVFDFGSTSSSFSDNYKTATDDKVVASDNLDYLDAVPF